MFYFAFQRQTLLTIAWFLTGLLLAGSLINALPAMKDSAVCAEERVLEADDDDRSDSLNIDLSLQNQVDEHPTSQAWRELQVFYCVQTISANPSAHLKRGPPTI